MHMTPFKGTRTRRLWIFTLPLVCILLLGAFSLLLSPASSHNTAHAAGTTATPVSDLFAQIISPTSSSALFVNQPVTITALASGGSSLTVAQVELRVDNIHIGTATSSPYSVPWTPLIAGIHTLMAFATLSNGVILSAPDETVTVRPGNPLTPPPPGPMVNITSPANGATFSNLDSIVLTANATPLAGTTVTEVDYFFIVEGSKPIVMWIGTLTLAPYHLFWDPTTITGTILLFAVAIDSQGRLGQSPTVPLQLNMATPTPTTGFCVVHYQLNSQWTGGFSVGVTITNTGTTANNGWVLQFTFPGDQQITHIWNGSIRQSGETVTISNLSYNASIAPGGSTNLGFNGTWTHNDNPPTSFTLNGMTCIIG